jgi:hypothetical protein
MPDEDFLTRLNKLFALIDSPSEQEANSALLRIRDTLTRGNFDARDLKLVLHSTCSDPLIGLKQEQEKYEAVIAELKQQNEKLRTKNEALIERLMKTNGKKSKTQRKRENRVRPPKKNFILTARDMSAIIKHLPIFEGQMSDSLYTAISELDYESFSTDPVLSISSGTQPISAIYLKSLIGAFILRKKPNWELCLREILLNIDAENFNKLINPVITPFEKVELPAALTALLDSDFITRRLERLILQGGYERALSAANVTNYSEQATLSL